MTLQYCAEVIARFQRTPKTSTKTEYYRSLRDDYIGSEERPCKRFRVLVAPSKALTIVEKPLPPSLCSSFTGWSAVSLRPSLSRPQRLQKEPADCKWKKGAPSTSRPGIRKGWFLSSEAERINTDRGELDAHQRWSDALDLDAVIPNFGFRVRKVTSLIGDVEDKGKDSSPFLSTRLKRCDLEALCRNHLKKLVDSKLQHQIAQKLGTVDEPAEVIGALSEAAVWAAKRLSLREIAEQTGRTQAWVRWRLKVVSRAFLSLGIKDLTERSQQESEIVAD